MMMPPDFDRLLGDEVSLFERLFPASCASLFLMTSRAIQWDPKKPNHLQLSPRTGYTHFLKKLHFTSHSPLSLKTL